MCIISLPKVRVLRQCFRFKSTVKIVCYLRYRTLDNQLSNYSLVPLTLNYTFQFSNISLYVYKDINTDNLLLLPITTKNLETGFLANISSYKETIFHINPVSLRNS